MAEKIQRDRGAVPALDALMEQTADAQLAQLTEALAAGFRAHGPRAEQQRALIRLALDFWTWRHLDREGLQDDTAADLMAHAVASMTPVRSNRESTKHKPLLAPADARS
jgi:hypothetical protein